jgi:Domain of unknown function (DUF4333)
MRYSPWLQRFRIKPRTTMAVVGVLAALIFAVLPATLALFSALSGSTPARHPAAITPSTPASVDRRALAAQITLKLTDPSGNKPDQVICPADLAAAVGATVNCQTTIGGQTHAVTVTVSGVSNEGVKYTITDAVDKNQVAGHIRDQLGQQLGHEPDSVGCPDDLPATVGATERCTMTDRGHTYGV